MPLYTFINTETGEETEQLIKLADREQYLADNPHLKQKVTAAALGDSVRLGIRKPDEGFREILRKVKKDAPRSNVNTY